MDAAEEFPHLFRPEKKPRFDDEAPQHSPAQVAAVAKVLDDDDLLREIIVRVGLPTTLLCAALVCKRWLGHASDPKFLSRFRKLHPPRLLGYFITEASVFSHRLEPPCFVAMRPQPPELTAIIRRLASYMFRSYRIFDQILDCRNGSVLTRRHDGTRWKHEVHQPLCAEKGIQIVPPLPPVQDQNLGMSSEAILSKEEGGVLSYLYVMGESTKEAEKSTVRVYMLQDGVWHIHTLATCHHGLHMYPKPLLVDNKIYMLAASGNDIDVLDLMASSISTIQLPEGVKCNYFNSRLSRADDPSSIYLIHVEVFQLRVWLHKGENWFLVDTICLHKMLAILGMSYHPIEDEYVPNVQIKQVGDNGQSVYLWMGQCLINLDIKCRTPCKVYENIVNNQYCCSIHPLMMIWPPTFPALKDDPARKLLAGQ